MEGIVLVFFSCGAPDSEPDEGTESRADGGTDWTDGVCLEVMMLVEGLQLELCFMG